ncbi:hypothetical protein U8C35_29035 (plasmid) [Sinorhizobium medicae]|uniref:hypothetical protein n=1 Tax=Sinorhizobium medicae TaxID=110321 RepID=UPI002AF6BB18|nr:hypothetical protein [Sinorhizobium medicae]WQO62165.1 hypothetical protein U8C35_29035 [Sinorhizobium medicae]
MVIVVAAWMLDPAICAGMTLGPPRASISALAELHRLLIEQRIRRSSLGNSTIVQEEQDAKPANIVAATGAAPTQHSIRFWKTPEDQHLGPADSSRPIDTSAVGGRRCRGQGA